ncbi:SDR family NAD(P)-dependent oxidoreductase, partial [Pseudomonas syringae]
MTRKVAMVTGAASGIGQALAVAFARQGVAVAGGYYPADSHDPDETRRLVEEAGGECLMLPLDVTFTASVD